MANEARSSPTKADQAASAESSDRVALQAAWRRSSRSRPPAASTAAAAAAAARIEDDDEERTGRVIFPNDALKNKVQAELPKGVDIANKRSHVNDR